MPVVTDEMLAELNARRAADDENERMQRNYNALAIAAMIEGHKPDPEGCLICQALAHVVVLIVEGPEIEPETDVRQNAPSTTTKQ